MLLECDASGVLTLLMKQVFSSPDSAQIGLAQSQLDAAGIACEVRNDAISQAMPGMPFTTELWVLRDEDYEDARRLLLSGSPPAELQ